MKTITIPKYVKKFWERAFRNCTSLETVVAEGSVPPVIGGTFSETFNGSKFHREKKPGIIVPVGTESAYMKEWDAWASYIKTKIDGTEGDLYWSFDVYTYELTISGKGDMPWQGGEDLPWKKYQEYITKVEIEGGVTKIGAGVFKGYENLKSVYIPWAVTRIDPDAFRMCPKLETVKIEASKCSIGENAFNGCVSLKNVYFWEGITEIGQGAFAGCEALREITVPESVTMIQDGAFRSCTELHTVTFLGTPDQIGAEAFLKDALV